MILDGNLTKYRSITLQLINETMVAGLLNINMYSANNEGKSVVVERFIRTLENKIYKYITSISRMCASIK